jgi:hypothetical protein
MKLFPVLLKGMFGVCCSELYSSSEIISEEYDSSSISEETD